MHAHCWPHLVLGAAVVFKGYRQRDWFCVDPAAQPGTTMFVCRYRARRACLIEELEKLKGGSVATGPSGRSPAARSSPPPPLLEPVVLPVTDAAAAGAASTSTHAGSPRQPDAAVASATPSGTGHAQAVEPSGSDAQMAEVGSEGRVGAAPHQVVGTSSGQHEPVRPVSTSPDDPDGMWL